MRYLITLLGVVSVVSNLGAQSKTSNSLQKAKVIVQFIQRPHGGLPVVKAVTFPIAMYNGGSGKVNLLRHSSAVWGDFAGSEVSGAYALSAVLGDSAVWGALLHGSAVRDNSAVWRDSYPEGE